jgi:hypothetical protein
LVIELAADDWYSVGSRPGVAFVFSSDRLPPEITHPRELLNETVLINGLPAVVTGVEHWAIECPRPALGFTRCEHPFSLLVKPGRWQSYLTTTTPRV